MCIDSFADVASCVRWAWMRSCTDQTMNFNEVAQPVRSDRRSCLHGPMDHVEICTSYDGRSMELLGNLSLVRTEGPTLAKFPDHFTPWSGRPVVHARASLEPQYDGRGLPGYIRADNTL
jgi:hypothetical protein